MSEEKEFEETVEGLEDETEYEFKAVVEWGHDTSTGEKTSFTTLQDATFEVIECEVPDEVNIEESFTIEATVENSGDVDGEYTVEFYLNGGVIDNETVEVEAGETKTASITHTIEEVGEHQIEVGEVEHTMTVEEEDTPVWVVPVLVILIVALLFTIWKAVPREKRESEQDEFDGDKVTEEKDIE